MKLVVISSAPIINQDKKLALYAPYEKEMQLWAKYTNSIDFCCPIWNEDKKLLIAPISFPVDTIFKLKEFDVTSFFNLLKAIPAIFFSFFIIFKAMLKADHIHLRCPGNMGLIASIVQIFFPFKKKTAKYAGNWDPKAKQPFTYKLQRWILSNTILTHNMQVLVYGNWPKQTKNIKPFFTATYFESDKVATQPRTFDGTIEFLFVGTLSKGKQPLYAVQLVNELIKNGKNVQLNLFGEGELRDTITAYIKEHSLQNFIFLNGNQSKETVLEAYKKSHFLLLPSKSEGWPKVVAEAMFWGCVPVVNPVSCVPFMLDYGKRGIILSENLLNDVLKINSVIDDNKSYQAMSLESQLWSQKYTLDFFEEEIKKLINQ